MISRRAKAFLLLGGGLILFGILVFFLIRFFKNTFHVIPPENQEQTGQIQDIPLVKTAVELIDPEHKEETSSGNNTGDSQQLETEVSRLAFSFAERFGSFSSQSDFSNILDLEVLMTTEMQKWIDEVYFPRLKSQYSDTPSFYGVTTKAIVQKKKSIDLDAGTAEFTLTTQRSEVFGKDAPQVRYEDIDIKLIKSEDAWKVDFVAWR